MNRILVGLLRLCLLLLLATNAPAAGPPLADDLCNLPVEGLTLYSTPAEVRAVFKARGWVDESLPVYQDRRRGSVEQLIFASSPSPEKTATPATTPKPTGYFTLVFVNGAGESILYYNNDPTAGDRLRAICAEAQGRFQTGNCTPKRQAVSGWGILVQPPAKPMANHCQLSATASPGRNPTRIRMEIGRHPGSAAQLGSPGRGGG